MQEEKLTLKKSVVVFYGAGISILLLIADYYSGPFIQFPISYLIPVAFVSWYSGRGWGLLFAFVLPLVRFYFNTALWTVPWTMTEATINAMIRIVVLSSFTIIIDRTAIQTRLLSRHIVLLEGLLPICSHCKRIRNENEQWQVLESYIMERSATTFTHGICPECMKANYADVLRPAE